MASVVRPVHYFEQFMGVLNVGVIFSISSEDACNITKKTIVRSLVLTANEHPIIRHVFVSDESIDVDGPKPLNLVKLADEDLFEDDVFVQFIDRSEPLPTGEALPLEMAEETRKTAADKSKGLFTVRVVKHTNGYSICFVVHHGITDGTSIFHIIDSFLKHLSRILIQEGKQGSELSQAQFADLLSETPVAPLRDLVAELLSNPKCAEPDHPTFSLDATNQLKYPKVTLENTDPEAGGCMRALFFELDEATTAGLVANCRNHKVGVQSVLSAAASLALIKLSHLAGESRDTIWGKDIGFTCPANMRRFLTTEGDKVDHISSCVSGTLAWSQPSFQSYEVLSNKLFWEHIVKDNCHKPIQELLGSNFVFQWLRKMENKETQASFPVVTSSVGNITTIQQNYEAFAVADVALQAGFYANSEESYLSPKVNEAMYSYGLSGFVMLHAYTVFGRMKFTGNYYAYNRVFIAQYFDEVRRILTVVSGGQEGQGDVKVGDIFTL